jgi:Flp pilus assembly protein TadD
MSGHLPDRRRFWVGAALLLLTLAAYEGVRHADFLHYDDDAFVAANPYVRQGLTREAIRWAFEADLRYDSPYADYWAPLTVHSRLLDVQVFGLRPAAHHLTNLALHGLTVIFLFAALQALTGAFWRSAFVAAVLAVHPVHVESVAWISERKDVLSGVFWMLTLIAYAGWVRSPGPWRRAGVVAAFACGLMAKPMLVTLPFVLLLLDAWPLGRLSQGLALIREKWPLFLLSAASVAITVATTAGLDADVRALPLGVRLASALDAYVSYLRHAFWPTGLGVGYPHLGAALPLARLGLCLLTLALITIVAVVARGRRPYLLVGWCWFVGTLLPTIGFVQVGVHGRADRYTYLPLVGISLAVAWTCADWATSHRRRVALGVLGGTLVLTLTVLTRRQVEYWKNDVTLFSHSIRVIPGNVIAQNGLAQALVRSGDLEGAETALREALRARPDLTVGVRNLAFVLMRRGRDHEAVQVVEQALATSPSRGPLAVSELHVALGLILARQGLRGAAEAHHAEAIRLHPQHWAAFYNLGNLLVAEGRFAEAEARYVKARRLNPDDDQILNNLGLVLLLQGRVEEAVALLSAGVKSFPSNALLLTSLGRALTAAHRDAEATVQLREAIQLAPQSAEAHFRLGQALAAQGSTGEASAHYREALRLDPTDAQARAALGNQLGDEPAAGKASPATR